MAVIEQAPARTPLSRNRDFLMLWVGAGVSALGSRATAIGYTLLVYWSTGSATAASLVTFAALLPNLVAQLPAGVFVDRWDRRRTMLFCAAGRIVAVGSVAGAVLAGAVSVPHLMVVAFVEATLGILYALAERAAVCTVVPRDQFGAAMAANESRGNAAGLLGQPASTMLYTVTRWAPFAFATVLHVVSFLTLLFVRRDMRTERAERRRMWPEVVEGLSFVWSRLYLRRALGLFAASNVLFQVLSLGLIVMVKEMGGSPPVIGAILVANGLLGMVGAMTSNLFLSRWGIRRIMMGINIAWAVLMPMVGIAPGFIALGLVFALIHYCAGVGNVAGMLYLVRATPDHLRGRAGSIATLLTSGANSAGALVAGVLLDSVSSTTAVLLISVAMLAIAVLAVLGFGGRAAAEAERADEAAAR